MASTVCSVKKIDCCSNDCVNCPGKKVINGIIKVLEAVDNIWMKNGSFQKVQIKESG